MPLLTTAAQTARGPRDRRVPPQTPPPPTHARPVSAPGRHARGLKRSRGAWFKQGFRVPCTAASADLPASLPAFVVALLLAVLAAAWFGAPLSIKLGWPTLRGGCLEDALGGQHRSRTTAATDGDVPSPPETDSRTLFVGGMIVAAAVAALVAIASWHGALSARGCYRRGGGARWRWHVVSSVEGRHRFLRGCVGRGRPGRLQARPRRASRHASKHGWRRNMCSGGAAVPRRAKRTLRDVVWVPLLGIVLWGREIWAAPLTEVEFKQASWGT